MDDIFKRFFGFSHRRLGDREPEEWSSQPPYTDGQFQDPDDLFHHLEQHFHDVFSSIGSMVFDVPTLALEIPQKDDNESKPLRDNMLKSPNQEAEFSDKSRTPLPWFRKLFELTPYLNEEPENGPLKDEDLDNAVSTGGLDAILKKPQQFVKLPSTSSVYSSSSSIRFSGSDGVGKIEEKVTRRDNFGNEYTTIKRRLGSQEHSVTTKKDEHGTEERNETFVNIDEKDLKDFESAWVKGNFTSHSNSNPAIDYSFPDVAMFGRLFKGFNHPPK